MKYSRLSAILALFVVTEPAIAAQQCMPNGVCTYFIPREKLPPITAQQTMVWCWAASAQTIFRYYGHDIQQEEIVQAAFGTVEISTAPPDVIVKMLNRTYTDASGRTFKVSTPRYSDSYGIMPGNIQTQYVQPGFSNAEIFNELSAERPVFYADGPHAMVLIGGTAMQGMPISGWVMDPAPMVSTFGLGPITPPGTPAVGVRQLQPNEMHAFFAAKVVVQ